MTDLWFLRQNGRCFPEYRAMRELKTISELTRDPNLAANIALMPIEHFGVTSCLTYFDLFIGLEELGLEIEVTSDRGPYVATPVANRKDVKRLANRIDTIDFSFLSEQARIISHALGRDDRTLGFLGGMYTLGAFAIRGRPARDFKDQINARLFIFEDPLAWSQLMDVVLAMQRKAIEALQKANVSRVLIFDSWAGSMGPVDYRTHILDWNRKLVELCHAAKMEVTLFSTGTGHLLRTLSEIRADVINVDWRHDLASAFNHLPAGTIVQGNLDPERLLGSHKVIREGVTDVLNSVGDYNRFRFNLGHGLIHDTDIENVQYLVRCITDDGRLTRNLQAAQ